MPVYVYAIVNAVLAMSVIVGIVGLQVWAVLTQHRDPECAEVRLRRLPRRLNADRKPARGRQLEAPAQEAVLG